MRRLPLQCRQRNCRVGCWIGRQQWGIVVSVWDELCRRWLLSGAVNVDSRRSGYLYEEPGGLRIGGKSLFVAVVVVLIAAVSWSAQAQTMVP